MSLKDQLFLDFKEAMKKKETLRKNTIQSIRTSALQMEKDQKIDVSEEDYVKIIANLVKKRTSALPEFEKSGRLDLIDELKSEIDILMTYLPKQLSDDEVYEIVSKTIEELGATSMKDMGKVMGVLSDELSGKADTKLVSQLVKKRLSQ
ncbi:Aspartyl-tRNA amidotransferase [Petrocella atlantisensis]|uniref:Aspartyl-tRNA amidotransferase n=1 Tax=Petrocella atlantisensis TaxID=2173034 RepID=A0A3P7PNL6_9FIRM|nr:GatB/YqeY domain-containing protein [Petrocella atlantisensis]VDN46107.1 Aspartyl-tRNA amidotransferase [Petrocella atlantisensis]